MELSNTQNQPIQTPAKKTKWWPGIIYPLLTIIFIALYSSIPALTGMTGKYARYAISHILYHYAPYLFGVSLLLLATPFILIKFLFHQHHLIVKIAIVLCVIVIVPVAIYSGIMFYYAGFTWVNAPTTEDSCLHQGGQWMTYWCNIRSKDFGKSCTDGSQCSNNVCYVEKEIDANGFARIGVPASGATPVCYPYEQVEGCITTVTIGQNSEICFD